MTVFSVIFFAGLKDDDLTKSFGNEPKIQGCFKPLQLLLWNVVLPSVLTTVLLLLRSYWTNGIGHKIDTENVLEKSW